MCNARCIAFVESAIAVADVAGRDVLDVGSYDVNGTVRPAIERLGPAKYVGVDISEGPGVDLVCNAEDLVDTFGEAAFDVVVTTEMLEHVEDWRRVVDNLKRVARPGGLIVITTRSRQYPLHGYPHDHWRYEPEDMRAIFADCRVERVEREVPDNKGIFVVVRKPAEDGWAPLDLSGYALWSVHSGGRVLEAEFAPPVPLDELLADAREENAVLRAQVDQLSALVQRYRDSRTFRYTAPIRRAGGSARRTVAGLRGKPAARG